MPEYSMFPKVFPLGVILFDFLFLLISIPIEAYILHRRLKFDKKTSSFYAIAINLFANVIGWAIFFLIEPVLPVDLKSQLISYVFFNQLPSSGQSLLFLTAVIIFFGTFVFKVLLLQLLLLSLTDPGQNKKTEVPLAERRSSRRANKFKVQNTGIFTALLIGNSFSYSAITVVILIRSGIF